VSQFNALPTTGHCEALLAWEVTDGYFGDTRLDGVCENYKDKNECAKAVASSFALIGMTQQEGLESYREL